MSLFSKGAIFYTKNSRFFYGFILIFFASIFALTSLLNHYYFRTYALDLGVFNHAIHQMAHFQKVYYMVGVEGKILNGFSGHFSPLLYIFIPFYWIFGSYGLLIVQVLAIVFGAVGIYRYSQYKGFSNENPISLLFVIHFFSIWGIYSVLSYDFHIVVIAAMLIPWFVLFYEKKQTIQLVVVFVLILLTKENMALWMTFVMLGLMVKNYKHGLKLLRLEVPLLVLSAFYFVLIFAVVMPSLSLELNGSRNHQLHLYKHIGNSLSDILKNLIIHPIDTFKLLYVNTLGDVGYNGVKQELHLMVLVSGGLALLYRPHYLIMLIPIYAQKLFSNNYALWGINYQYSIEFVPILSLAVIDTFASIKRANVQRILALGTVVLCMYFTFDKIRERKSLWYTKVNAAFYSKDHYKSLSGLPVANINKALKLIPNDAIVSSTASLLPHLCFRDKIYHYPNINDANYIALLFDDNYYPLNNEKFKSNILELRANVEFEVVYDKDKLLIFRKKVK